jgi:hypothetical protein
MSRQWRVHRQWIETQDAQQRWDRAYQYLLHWSREAPSEQTAGQSPHAQHRQEVKDESGSVRPSVDPTGSPDPDH